MNQYSSAAVSIVGVAIAIAVVLTTTVVTCNRRYERSEQEMLSAGLIRCNTPAFGTTAIWELPEDCPEEDK